MTWLSTKPGPWTLDKTRDLSVDWVKDLNWAGTVDIVQLSTLNWHKTVSKQGQ